MHIKIIYAKPGTSGLTSSEQWSCYVPYFQRDRFTVRHAVEAWEKWSGHRALFWCAI